MEEETGEIVVMRSRYTLCIKDAVMANFRIVVLDSWREKTRVIVTITLVFSSINPAQLF